MTHSPHTPAPCPNPSEPAAAQVMAATAATRSGAGTYKKRHQRARLASYARSRRLILTSFTAAIATIASTAQAVMPTASSVANTSCISVAPDFFIQYTLSTVFLTVPCILIALFLWYGVLNPLVACAVNRWIAASDARLDAIVDARARQRRQQEQA